MTFANPDSGAGWPTGDPVTPPEQPQPIEPATSQDLPTQADQAPASGWTQPTWTAWSPSPELAAPPPPLAGPPPAPTTSGPAWSPTPPAQSTVAQGSPGGPGRGTVVAAAVLAAILAAGGTLGLVELARPQAAVAPSTAPAELTSTATSSPAPVANASGIAGQPIVQIAAKAGPAVVTITSTSAGFGGADTSIGSGFVVRSDGYILTNRHVVSGGGDLTVELADGRQFSGTVVGTDPQHDLAVVKIDSSNLPTLTLGDSDKLQIGQLAVAIGDPEGTFPGSVTSGVISGTGRSIDVQDAQTRQRIHLSGLLQTDTAINEGNSGGPLLNAGGQVIGINTATDSSGQGIGFATPINTAKTLLDQAEAGNATTN
jgi:S1-C subfamily serine protease